MFPLFGIFIFVRYYVKHIANKLLFNILPRQYDARKNLNSTTPRLLYFPPLNTRSNSAITLEARFSYAATGAISPLTRRSIAVS